jgi:hypothetical protein
VCADMSLWFSALVLKYLAMVAEYNQLDEVFEHDYTKLFKHWEIMLRTETVKNGILFWKL